MLDLHQEILLQIKSAVSSSETQPDKGNMSQRQARRGQLNSIVSSEGAVTRNPTHSARPSKDFAWLGRSKKTILMTAPSEAADIARTFDRMVCIFTGEDLRDCLY